MLKFGSLDDQQNDYTLFVKTKMQITDRFGKFTLANASHISTYYDGHIVTIKDWCRKIENLSVNIILVVTLYTSIIQMLILTYF